eukprot:comp21100_c0_seq1/m.28494 comp21100_c0_seq1/g.28494  ORF comp21100_c0_seq1/g.28494 comp21100_c0_seq1/m.28494 type:complete len:385 (-) comp21100_c0_seq1:447-1601(-)
MFPFLLGGCVSVSRTIGRVGGCVGQALWTCRAVENTRRRFSVGAARMGAGKVTVVAKNGGEFLDTPISEKDFLLTFPRGAYTTARTVNGDSVFDYDFHVRRLSESVKLMLQTNKEKGVGEVDPKEGAFGDVHLACDPAYLRPQLTHLLSCAVRRYHDLAPTQSHSNDGLDDVTQAHVGECKLTILVSWGDESHSVGGSYDIFAHVVAMPPVPRPPVRVLVHGSPRENPHAKDSQWVRDRQALDQNKPSDVNEILLVDDQGSIAEGMSSNFFAVTLDGVVETADEGILKGTVRDVTLQVCRDLGIPVRLCNPQLQDINQWQGAFITSTSRLVLPIDIIDRHPTDLHLSPTEDSVERVNFNTQDGVVRRIREGVLKKVAEVSTKIL